MTTFVSILRGINVGGKNPIKMNDLKKMFETLGFTSIETYIQSGNVVFKSNLKEVSHLESIIFDEIEQIFNYQIPVIVISKNDYLEIVNSNPFLDDDKEEKFLHITFLGANPDLSNWEEINSKKKDGEAISITNRAAYLYCPFGYGSTKLNNNFLEAKLKSKATTRNYKTVQALVKMLQ